MASWKYRRSLGEILSDTGSLRASRRRSLFQSNLRRTYVSDVERGARNPTVAIVARLAVMPGVKPAKLLEYQKDQ